MANLSEDIQCAGSDTRPPMLERADFASWQQHIRLYCQGKENWVNILKSIDEGPFQIGTLRETLAEGEEVDPLALLSNVSPQQYSSQSSTTPPSIYVLQVTYQPHFVDNTQLDSGLSPIENSIENLTNILSLLTQSYKTYLHQTDNQLRTSLNTRNQATVQDGRVVVQNVQVRRNRGQRNNPRGAGAAGNGGVQNRVRNANPGGYDIAVDKDVDEPHVQDLALNVNNVFQADKCDALDSDVDEDPTAQTMFIANLSSAYPVYDEAGPLYDSNILSEYVKDNVEPVVQSNVSSVPDDAYMMIINEMNKQATQYVFANKQNKVVNASLTAELARYKEQLELYERGPSLN
nr:hypothetical protein [Tanacetum cinerariifolium]